MSADDLKLVEKAWHYATDAHSEQFRQSGEPYIIHPIQVAGILADLHLDAVTVACGFLHDVEILTNPLGDFIAAHDNHKRCFGIIGSGNRNFNNQYCLTAKQYSQRFGFPMLGDFELRGTQSDIERLAPIILEAQKNFIQL